MMTEDEARTKWCPMVRFHFSREAAYDNKPLVDGEPPPQETVALCIASDCMMWKPATRIQGAPGDKGDCGLKR